MTTDSDSPTDGAPTRNIHAINLLTTVPRDRPMQARVMREAAEEIDRLQSNLIEERRRFAQHLAAWTANSHYHAERIATLEARGVYDGRIRPNGYKGPG